MNPFNDKPIEGPGDDQFRFSRFAEAIAQSIFRNESPEGTVIAIRGPWGSGKSSVINLVKHYLEEEMKSAQPQEASDDTNNSVNIPIQILDFKCWWFKGEEALMLEFFRQLYGALDHSGLEKAKEAISQLGSRILSGSAPWVGAAVNSVAPGGGAVVSSGMNLLSNLIKQEKTVEKLYSKISEELLNIEKRYLMIIDDIDRLSPDEALLIFRLVKSVGQLPKITYLLAYDREVAEKIVSKHYPSEKSHYLEKIVQAGFDIPYPLRSDLKDTFIQYIEELWNKPENSIHWKEYQNSEFRHFWNLFNDVVESHIQSPRDIIRIMNTLRVTWPAVVGEVDPADFLALETLRVKQPSLYDKLKDKKEILTGIDMDRFNEDKNSRASRYEDIFIHDFQGEKRAEMKNALRCLFPPLAAVWAGHVISDSSREEWKCQRRACSPAHFDTYFRFSLSQTISLKKVQAVIKNSGNIDYVKNAFLQASQIQRRNERGTYASVLLDELKVHAKDIPIQNAKVFLSALFSVYEKFDTEIDLSDNFMIISNDRRIYFLLENLLLNRTEPDKRSAIIVNAIQFADLYLTIFITITTRLQYHPPQGKFSEPENSCLITKSDMEYLCKMSAKKIKTAVENDELLSSRNPLDLLNHWNLLAGSDQSEKAKSWCMSKLNDDNAVEIFAKELTSESRGVTAVDSAPIISYFINIDMLEKFFDIESFRQRVEQLLSESQPENERYVTLKRFLDAFNEH